MHISKTENPPLEHIKNVFIFASEEKRKIMDMPEVKKIDTDEFIGRGFKEDSFGNYYLNFDEYYLRLNWGDDDSNWEDGWWHPVTAKHGGEGRISLAPVRYAHELDNVILLVNEYWRRIDRGLGQRKLQGLPSPDCHFYDEETDRWIWAYSVDLLKSTGLFLEAEDEERECH